MNEYQADRSMNAAASNAARSFEREKDIVLAQQNALQCPTCTFATSNRSKFIDHLINYCTSKCNNDSTTLKAANLPVSPALKYLEGNDKCSPTTREEYSGCETKEINEPNVHTCNVISRVDSRETEGTQEGREKYRENKSCKQCSFVTNTKMEYWEHMRCHIKGFTCSECSFVTKYKHHMNHHWLSVHDGSKPFKCKKCSYTCVSKSMLTSHQKKHSNVYPYRCANCNYKTKFCNALKKHLRKKEHRPAMVLNADGSPNPLFVIDVYGTKRGPKQKLSTDKRDELNRNTDVTIADNDNRTTGSAGPTCPVISSLESPPVARHPTATAMNGANDANYGINQNGRNKKNRSIVTFPYSDLAAAFNLSSHLSFPEDATIDTQDTPKSDTLIEYEEMKTNVRENDRITETQTFVQNPRVTFFDTTSDTTSGENGILDRDVKAVGESSVLVTLKSQLGMTQRNEFMDTPLDLRIAEAMERNRLEFQLLATSSPKTIGTSKRKGRAIKLERRRVTFEEDADEKSERNQIVEPPSLDHRDAIERKLDVEKEIEDARGRKAVNDSVDIEFVCHYCEIMFGNVVMYTVHMGCHGFDDPFTCNMCGHQCIDKLSFFLHIAKSEHM